MLHPRSFELRWSPRNPGTLDFEIEMKEVVELRNLLQSHLERKGENII